MSEKEDILEGLREIKEALRETRISIERLMEGKKDIDRKIKELVKSQEETDKKMKELMERQKKTDEQMRETDKQLKETDRRIKALTKAISELNGVWQNYTEDTIREGLENALKELGFEEFYLENKRKRKGMEVDALAVGRDYVIVVEVKTTLKQSDVDDFESKLKERFLKVFHEYEGFKVYGAVAGMRIQEGIDRYASKKGFIVLKHKDGKDVKVLNEEGFKPKDFSAL